MNFKKTPVTLNTTVMNTKYYFILLLSFALFSGCIKDKEEETQSTFDRTAMLTNYADQIIIPSYLTFQEEVTQLRQEVLLFSEETSASQLENLRSAFIAAYKSWQHCSAYEFGPASDVAMRSTINTFPTDLETIENHISSGSYNLESLANIDAIGLPALDYLIYGNELAENEILGLYTEDSNASNRISYLRDVTDQILFKIDYVVDGWSAGQGNYRAEFLEMNGTDVGSSLGHLINEFNFDLEILKNAKIGIPLGKQTLGLTLTEKVEGYYGKVSNLLIKEQITAYQNLFEGRDQDGVDFMGLSENIDAVDARHGSNSLSEKINTQFDDINTEWNQVTATLSEAIETEYSEVNDTYQKIQQMVVLTKTDLPSALGVLITYQDNDGD